jgi:DGQHR domain-containing protein
MIRIPVLKVNQKDIEFYLLSYDPRKIIRLVNIPDKSTMQESQRPWKESRVKEISKYIAGKLNISDEDVKQRKAKGLIPNCPILSIYPPLRIISDGKNTYIEMPDTENEILDCKNKCEIIDGQHRLISFNDEYIDPDFKNSENYSMGFVIFDNLTLNEKREIFMISNEKQEKVEKNVLNQFKKWLGLLSEDDEKIYNLICQLNNQRISPLINRFNIGGEKFNSRLSQVEATKILKKSNLYNLLNENKLQEDQQLKVLCNYFRAWSLVYSDEFNNFKHILGKISGFRFICCLFPYIWDILKEEKKTFIEENVTDILKVLKEKTENDNLFQDKKLSLAFRSESATIRCSKDYGNYLKKEKLENKVFNPAIF